MIVILNKLSKKYLPFSVKITLGCGGQTEHETIDDPSLKLLRASKKMGNFYFSSVCRQDNLEKPDKWQQWCLL